MHVLLIANPASTTQTAELFRRVIPRLREVEGLHLEARFTHRSGHAEDMVRGMTRRDWDVIIPAGGDGTVNEVINGLLGPADALPPDATELPVVAVLPTGSANVFARALGYPVENLAAADMLVALVRNDLRRRISLGTWSGDGEGARWFAVNAGFGIDAEVIARVERARSRGFAASPLLYLQLSIQAWLRAQVVPPEITVTAVSTGGARIDHHDLPMMVASNTNPWTFLGPLPVVTNPRNSFDSGLGLFGLSSVRGPGGVAAMMHLIGVGHGRRLERLIDRRTIQFDDAAHVTLTCDSGRRFQVDGEYEGKPRAVELSSVPDVLEVMAPRRHPSAPTRSWALHALRYVCDFIRVRV